jgi:hypothetical protein
MPEVDLSAVADSFIWGYGVDPPLGHQNGWNFPKNDTASRGKRKPANTDG